MILLEDYNRVLHNSLAAILSEKEERSVQELNFCDFDQTKYNLKPSETNSSFGWLSISAPGLGSLLEQGLRQRLEHEYADVRLKVVKSLSSYDLTVEFSLDKLTKENVHKLSLIRRNCLAIPLYAAFEAQRKGQASELVTIPLRSGEFLFIKAEPDRVMCIIATKFDDPSDVVLGRVFLQEFYDHRKQASMQNTPAVLLSKEVPKELEGSTNLGLNEQSQSFVTFVLFPRHFTEGEREERTISLILSFRDYFHYHIKSTKAYLHTRMRSKVTDFLKSLNRAKAEGTT